MKKIANFIIQSVAYLGIVLLIFFISRKFGINSDSSIWSLAIGSTIGWIIVQGISTIKKKEIKQQNK
ncbi:hypothetical protein CFB3_07420 [Clostridium folliculivorans]|nr:hypothetical protein CFB3_07420 [Clostridium folliculivorans]